MPRLHLSNLVVKCKGVKRLLVGADNQGIDDTIKAAHYDPPLFEAALRRGIGNSRSKRAKTSRLDPDLSGGIGDKLLAPLLMFDGVDP